MAAAGCPVGAASSHSHSVLITDLKPPLLGTVSYVFPGILKTIPSSDVVLSSLNEKPKDFFFFNFRRGEDGMLAQREIHRIKHLGIQRSDRLI